MGVLCAGHPESPWHGRHRTAVAARSLYGLLAAQLGHQDRVRVAGGGGVAYAD